MRFTWWVPLLSIPLGGCRAAESGSGSLDQTTAGFDSAGDAGDAEAAGQDQSGRHCRRETLNRANGL